MTRPILWALGVLGAAALSGVGTGGLLANRPTAAGQAAPTGSGEGLLVVSADLQGHFVVHPSLGGVRVRMLVDTGASLVSLSHEDAFKAGVKTSPSDPVRRFATANGTIDARVVRLPEVSVGGLTVRDVEAAVMPPGRLGTSLLGMSFLRRLKSVEVASGRLMLRD